MWIILISTCALLSCTQVDLAFPEPERVQPDTLIAGNSIYSSPYNKWSPSDRIEINQYATMSLSHQSAAAYGDYVIFVAAGRSVMYLFNLKRKEVLYSLSLNGVSSNTYHCNQSSFGISRYDPSDPFPLLYVSQRVKTDKRCFIEIYRILPHYNEVISDYDSFSIDLVQTIYLPAMSYENSLGNANCVIDSYDGLMYTYSRNNNSAQNNYGVCKITCFNIPNIENNVVTLEDSDILSSFLIDAQAINMQGGCIKDGILYIGQGSLAAGYIYLNVIDLKEKKLITRINLQKYRVTWEPEGCIFYDGSVMLTHTSAICRIDK